MGIPYAEVIGDPIAHSKSPLIHNFWLDKLRLRADYRSTRVSPPEMGAYLSERRKDPAWLGCNVTAPLKEAALEGVDWLQRLADKASPLAPGVGAINTIVRHADVLAGFNTDVFGILELAREIRLLPETKYPVSHIIGAGGAARAAAVALSATPFGSWFFFNRDAAKARNLSAEFRGHPGDGFGLERLNEPQRTSSVLVVNATPMGMIGQPQVPIDLNLLSRNSIIFDMVYEPVETSLILQARELGLRVIDGLEMLVGQAAPAFELLFGVAAPRQHDPELRELLTA